MSKLTRTVSTAPLVQVAVLFCSDTSVGITREQFRANVDASIKAVRQYFWDVCDGRTFNAAPAVLVEDVRTEAAFWAANSSNLTAVFVKTMQAAHNAGLVDLRSPWRFPCFTTPCSFTDASFIGLNVSSTFFTNDDFPQSATHVIPGASFVGSDYYGRWLGNVGSSGSQADGRGILAHELGHGFGAAEYVAGTGPGQWEALPHSATVAAPGTYKNDVIPASPRLMAGGGSPSSISGGTFPTLVLSAMEKARILRSPFLIAQTRPV